MEITEAAVQNFKNMLSEADVKEGGIRIFLVGGGCCASYGLDVAEKAAAGDELIEKDGLKLFVARDAYDNLAKATIDYVDGFIIKGLDSACCG